LLRQGNRKLKVEELHSDLQCPANTRIAPPQAAAKLNPRPFYYRDLAITLLASVVQVQHSNKNIIFTTI
jgi:hypothetical protein